MKAVLWLMLILPTSLWACSPSPEEVRKSFMEIDKDKDVSLNSEEMELYFKGNPSKFSLSSGDVFSHLDKDKNQKISLDEYDPMYGIKNRKRCMP